MESSAGECGKVSDEHIDATVRPLGAKQWELELTSKATSLTEVWFPWEPRQTFLNNTPEDDLVYYPHLMGAAEKASTVKEWDWWGMDYPGDAFTPLVVVADDTAARIVAAVNWPPRRVTPVYSLGRLSLRYRMPIAPYSTARFRALLASTRGDPDRGLYAWHLALDAYKDWLVAHMRQTGLYPIDYAADLRRVHGWLNIQLHHLPSFRVDEVRALHSRYGHVFPWLQFWGQTSNYKRNPLEGRTAQPDPPLEPGEQVGGCQTILAMHRRYVPDLPELARAITRAGGYVGYYQRPPAPYGRLDVVDSPHLKFLLSWIEANKANGANAFYLDVLGAEYFGAPLAVARMFQTVLPRMSVIEYPVDVYPAAFMISGSLWGYTRWSTKPGQTPDDLNATLTRVSFPRFGRYLLDDRIMFLGYCNLDFAWWGNSRGHQHWTERQVFLLGAKFDAPTRLKGQPGWVNPLNHAVRQIVAERERVDWWDREPAYRDRDGIHGLPPGVDVRRFVDKNGETLFVVDNWRQQRKQSFCYKGREILIPSQQLCIMALPKEYDPDR